MGKEHLAFPISPLASTGGVITVNCPFHMCSLMIQNSWTPMPFRCGRFEPQTNAEVTVEALTKKSCWSRGRSPCEEEIRGARMRTLLKHYALKTHRSCLSAAVPCLRLTSGLLTFALSVYYTLIFNLKKKDSLKRKWWMKRAKGLWWPPAIFIPLPKHRVNKRYLLTLKNCPRA